MPQNVAERVLANQLNGIGIPLAATGLVYPNMGNGGDSARRHDHFLELGAAWRRLLFDAILTVRRVAELVEIWIS